MDAWLDAARGRERRSKLRLYSMALPGLHAMGGPEVVQGRPEDKLGLKGDWQEALTVVG
jgi:hypothetical protein